MLYDHLLFFFSALGAFNGVALAIYLWCAASSSLAQRALAVLILMVSVRTGKSVVFYFLPDTPAPIMQAGLTACMLIGPALYFFTRASVAATLHRAEWWHGGMVACCWRWRRYLICAGPTASLPRCGMALSSRLSIGYGWRICY